MPPHSNALGDSSIGQPVVHWEFWSKDPAKLSGFYRQVFGWEIRHIPGMDQHLVDAGGQGARPATSGP